MHKNVSRQNIILLKTKKENVSLVFQIFNYS
jgi:hypothetical protein